MDPQKLIDPFYEAGDGTRSWSSALASIAEDLGSDKGHLFILGPSGEVVENHFHGYGAELIPKHHQEFLATDPRFLFAIGNPGRVGYDGDLLETPFEESVVYHELLKALDVRHSLFVTAPIGPGLTLAHAFMRPHGAESFSRTDVDAMQRSLPHLQRALRMRTLLDSAADQVSDLLGALDAMAAPVAVVDGQGRLRCASTRAEALLAGPNGLVRRNDKLSAVLHQDWLAIEAAVQRAATMAEGPGAGLKREPILVEIQREGRRPLRLHFNPLTAGAPLRIAADSQARILIVFDDPEESLALNPDLLRSIYGLTPTEALLAVRLAQGATLAQFALERGSSEQTVRTHLKRIFQKTQTLRQADLIRLVLSNSALRMRTR